jgi:2-hydroxychromene-2-carboxylate isomerase
VPDAPAAFFFDLGSPFAYFAAEQALHAFAAARQPVEWQPVLAAELPGAESFEAFRCEGEREAQREELARRASELGLQPLRLPASFPFDSALAMRVATYAKSIGRTVPFAQAAFRQAFAGGRSLADEDTVLIAAAACEMHPTAVLRGAALSSVARQLAETTRAALDAGVRDVPAVLAAGRVFAGERMLAQAAEQLAGATLPGGGAGAPRGPLPVHLSE